MNILGFFFTLTSNHNNDVVLDVVFILRVNSFDQRKYMYIIYYVMYRKACQKCPEFNCNWFQWSWWKKVHQVELNRETKCNNISFKNKRFHLCDDKLIKCEFFLTRLKNRKKRRITKAIVVIRIYWKNFFIEPDLLCVSRQNKNNRLNVYADAYSKTALNYQPHLQNGWSRAIWLSFWLSFLYGWWRKEID